jgi:hypothetical protein
MAEQIISSRLHIHLQDTGLLPKVQVHGSYHRNVAEFEMNAAT